MTEGRLRNGLALFVLSTHCLIPLVAFGLFLVDGFLYEELTTTLGLVVPLFAASVTAITRFIIRNRSSADSLVRVNGAFVVLSYGLASFLVLAVVGLMVLKAFNYGLSSFEQFKVLLGISQGVYGVYLGRVITALYGQLEAASTT